MKKPNLLNVIKKQYPNPRVAPKSFREITKSCKNHYCVGGALCLYLNQHGIYTGFVDPVERHPLNFPSQQRLSYFLQEANPRLDITQADYYAEQIIDWNDDGQFSSAWRTLAAALNYAKQK